MDTKQIERRVLHPGACELRVETKEGEPPKIKGYAAVFDKRSEDLGGWFETIAPGAFGESLKNGADVRALVEHDSRGLLGRNTAGTLKLKEDKTGLSVEIDAPDTTAGRDVVESIKRGDLSGMSFGFSTIDDHWETQDGEELRTLEAVELFDVSVVAYPAYPDTSVAVRSLEVWHKQNTEAPTPKLNLARLELEEVDTA